METVTVEVEIPKQLYESLTFFVESSQRFDWNTTFTGAIALFLLQNGTSSGPEASKSYRLAARTYLDTIFRNAV